MGPCSLYESGAAEDELTGARSCVSTMTGAGHRGRSAATLPTRRPVQYEGELIDNRVQLIHSRGRVSRLCLRGTSSPYEEGEMSGRPRWRGNKPRVPQPPWHSGPSSRSRLTRPRVPQLSALTKVLRPHRLHNRSLLLRSTLDDHPCAYLCGNSLGLASRRSRELVEAEMTVWATRYDFDRAGRVTLMGSEESKGTSITLTDGSGRI
jgi:hypothetical protein